MMLSGILGGIRQIFNKEKKRAKIDQRGESTGIKSGEETPQIDQFGQDSPQLAKVNPFQLHKETNHQENQHKKKLNFLDFDIEGGEQKAKEEQIDEWILPKKIPKREKIAIIETL